MSNLSMVFDGYYREVKEEHLPTHGGIYAVYRCTHNVSEGTVSIHQLLYIGQAQDLHARITCHEKKPAWKAYLKYGEEICYGVAQISFNRDRAEAALIRHHKPPVNTEFVNSFPFETTTMALSGKTALLSQLFTVQSTESLATLLTRR